MRKAPARPIMFVLPLLLCAGALAAPRRAQKPAPVPGPQQEAQQLMATTSPDALVARVIQNELAESDEGSSHMYRDWRQTPDGSKTKQMIDTRDGVVARLIAINDRPLSPEEQAAEEARLQNLLSHPALQKQKQKEQQQDSDRVRKMFRELPKAFQYQYAGIESGEWGELIKLNFTPKPGYQPPSRETSVFRAMSGQMWVSVPDLRLARIEATLFRDVNFGWGILGHLDKGGHFFVSQSKVGPKDWEATYMNIQFTGRALLFKTINLRQVEKLSDFREVPNGLSLAQGIELLRKNGRQVAANDATPGK